MHESISLLASSWGCVSSETLTLHQSAGKGLLFSDLYRLSLHPGYLYCLHLALGHQSGSPGNSMLVPCSSWSLKYLFCSFCLTLETMRQSGISAYIPQIVISSLGSCHVPEYNCVCTWTHKVLCRGSAHPLLPRFNPSGGGNWGEVQCPF